jgi:hypothetical protein
LPNCDFGKAELSSTFHDLNPSSGLQKHQSSSTFLAELWLRRFAALCGFLSGFDKQE